ncbi:11162_t:CDS:2, partial [Cetraspora pellucida]
PESKQFSLVLQIADSTLRDHLKSKCNEGLYQISWDELIRLAKGISNGLKYLHDKGIIHRDLHSMNILINEGNALIADFGISKDINDPNSNSLMKCYIDLFSRCWSSAPEDRPELDMILSQLERLSTEPIKKITNRIVVRNKINANQDDSIDDSIDNSSAK